MEEEALFEKRTRVFFVRLNFEKILKVRVCVWWEWFLISVFGRAIVASTNLTTCIV